MGKILQFRKLERIVQPGLSPNVSFWFNSGTCDGSWCELSGDNKGKDKSATWKGKLQAEKSGDYKFDFGNIMRYAVLKIDDVIVASHHTSNCEPEPAPANNWHDVHLIKGQMYNLELKFSNCNISGHHSGSLSLNWKPVCSDAYETVPARNLYPEGAPTSTYGTSSYGTGVCYQPNQIQVTENAFVDDFKLIPGKKMVAGIWIKKGGQDCKCNNYTGIALDIKNASDNQVINSLQATSKIIEGWQLFECEFTVPENSTGLSRLQIVSANEIFYLDDLRIHPFNANMK